jgi:magnesium transporter
MRTLTVISVITFPLTLLATLLGVNAADNPFIHANNGFLMIIVLLLWVTIVMMLVFKRRKWI